MRSAQGQHEVSNGLPPMVQAWGQHRSSMGPAWGQCRVGAGQHGVSNALPPMAHTHTRRCTCSLIRPWSTAVCAEEWYLVAKPHKSDQPFKKVRKEKYGTVAHAVNIKKSTALSHMQSTLRECGGVT